MSVCFEIYPNYFRLLALSPSPFIWILIAILNINVFSLSSMCLPNPAAQRKRKGHISSGPVFHLCQLAFHLPLSMDLLALTDPT